MGDNDNQLEDGESPFSWKDEEGNEEKVENDTENQVEQPVDDTSYDRDDTMFYLGVGASIVLLFVFAPATLIAGVFESIVYRFGSGSGKRENDLGQGFLTASRVIFEVGVILSIIGIILGALAMMAVFVLDLGGTVSQSPQAGVTFDQQGSEVSVMLVSMENADYVSVSPTGSCNVGQNRLSSVGDASTVSGCSPGDTIRVTATLEGKTSVIQTYTVK